MPAGHFYSPLPDLDDVRARAQRIFDRERESVPGVDLNTEAQLSLASRFAGYYVDLPFPEEPREGVRYYLNNPFFTYGDGIFLYCMLRDLEPRRIVEIGSGFSSAAMLDTFERAFEEPPRVTFVDPDLSRLRDLLRAEDERQHELRAEKVQDVDLALFDELGEGDLLFIDSSHVAKVGSDVNFLLFEVLPRLTRGVHVHFHDVLYPFEYHEHWVMEGRAWNEAYLLRAFLQFNETFAITCFPTYAVQFNRPWFEQHMPLVLKNPGGSLWLQRVR